MFYKISEGFTMDVIEFCKRIVSFSSAGQNKLKHHCTFCHCEEARRGNLLLTNNSCTTGFLFILAKIKILMYL